MASDVNMENFFKEFYCLKTGATSNKSKFEACLQHFDSDKDGKLDRQEFHRLFLDLFVQNGQVLDELIEDKIFDILDEDKDGLLSSQEFYIGWRHWLKQVLDPVSALIVIDVQNDFIDGSLSLKACPSQHYGGDVIAVINDLIDTVPFDVVVYSKDWHPGNHISFIDNVLADNAHVLDEVVFEDQDGCIAQTLWPVHCVQNTHGAELHKDLKIRHDGIVIHKGTNSEIDSYSAFWDNSKKSRTELCDVLKRHRVTDVYLCGIAYDVCVGFTAYHALEHGFRTVLIEDACRGVNLCNIDKTRAGLQDKGAVVVNASQVKSLVLAQDRRLKMGYQAALNLELAQKLVKTRNSSTAV